MKSLATVALSLALATAIAAPAFAGGHGDHGNFPMKAAEFKQKVEERLAKRKARIEKRIADDKLDAARAKEIRDRFAERAAKIRAAFDSAAQDGVITKEEAKAIRHAGGGRHGHGKHKA